MVANWAPLCVLAKYSYDAQFGLLGLYLRLVRRSPRLMAIRIQVDCEVLLIFSYGCLTKKGNEQQSCEMVLWGFCKTVGLIRQAM